MSFQTRPHSAFPTYNRYDLSTKQYRVPQPEAYNKLKNDIYRTFSLNTSDTYTDIMQLTKDSQKYYSRIDRLCSKYCIKPTNKNSISTNIDSQKIAKNFVRSKGKQKQSQQRKNYINHQLVVQAKTVRLSTKKYQTQEFFKLTCENLKKLQKNEIKDQNQKKSLSKRKSSKSKSRYDVNKVSTQKEQCKSHPYLKIYEQSQKQALNLILNNDNIEIKYDETYPALQQADEWQKYQKKVKNIYTGIKRMRYIHSARQAAKSSRSSFQAEKSSRYDTGDKDNFYIT